MRVGRWPRHMIQGTLKVSLKRLEKMLNFNTLTDNCHQAYLRGVVITPKYGMNLRSSEPEDRRNVADLTILGSDRANKGEVPC